jgi:hypothetical protein
MSTGGGAERLAPAGSPAGEVLRGARAGWNHGPAAAQGVDTRNSIRGECPAACLAVVTAEALAGEHCGSGSVKVAKEVERRCVELSLDVLGYRGPQLDERRYGIAWLGASRPRSGTWLLLRPRSRTWVGRGAPSRVWPLPM